MGWFLLILYILGVIGFLIFAGYMDNTRDYAMVAVSLFWPILVLFLIVAGLFLIPYMYGHYLKRKEEEPFWQYFKRNVI